MCFLCSVLIIGGQDKLIFKPDLTLEEVEAENPKVHRGRYRPEECKALQRVAILIPHRNREKHLMYLLEHLHPFLQRQQLDYGIYTIHQVSVGQTRALPSDSPLSEELGCFSILVKRSIKLSSKERSLILSLKGVKEILVPECGVMGLCAGKFYCLFSEPLEEACFVVSPSMLANDCLMIFPGDLPMFPSAFAGHSTMRCWICVIEHDC